MDIEKNFFDNPVNLFTGHTVDDSVSASEYHCFVTEAPTGYEFSNLGLSTYTKRTFDQWKKENQHIMNFDPSFNDGQDINITVWRNTGRNGDYITFKKITDWTYESFKYDDLNLNNNISIIQQIIGWNDSFVLSPSQISDAQKQFLIDVKSSVERSISWTIDKVEIAKPNVVPKEVNLNQKLYLFDNSASNRSDRKIAIKDFNIVDYKSNYVDGEYKDKINGELSGSINYGLPSDAIVTNIDKKYVEYLNKWESGTPQLVAKLITDIPAAESYDLNDLIEKPNESLLSSSIGQQVVFGSAIPIQMQNANPKQWSPSYKLTKSERELEIDDNSKNEKNTVRVYNIFPRAFTSGEMIYLNRIDGVWLPSPIGAESTPKTQPLSASISQWNFTYLMANKDNYFRKFNANGSVNSLYTPSAYEDEFRKRYYQAYSTYNQTVASLNATFTFDFFSSPSFMRHITGFDFMGQNIGGTRSLNGQGGTISLNDGHGISQTVANLNWDYTTNDAYPARLGYESQYFGAVFPNGYVLSGRDDLFDGYDSDLMANNNGENYFYYNATAPAFSSGKNRNIIGGNDGMFGSNARTNGVAHLPADIALNAPPINSKNGSPILRVKGLYALHDISPGVTGINLFDATKEFLWNTGSTYKFYSDNSAIDGYHRFAWLSPYSLTNDSLKKTGIYDLSPIDKSTVQFKPLTIEGYAAWEGNGTTVTRYAGSLADHVISFGHYARNKVTDNLNIYSDLVNTRIGGTGSIIRYGSNSQQGGSSQGCKYPTLWGDGTSDFDTTIWNQDWASEPSHAVGVIAASCGLTTNQASIEINATYVMGLYDRYTGSNIITGPQYERRWGGSNTVNSLGTMALHCRVFEDWPFEQTVHDPRNFAVFHYADGIQAMTENFHEVLGKIYQNNVVVATGTLSSANGRRWSPILKFPAVDYRVPTYENNNYVPTGQFIYSDTPNLKDPDDWLVDPRARGKLLPFTFNKRVLGVGNIHVVNYGSGYQDGDTFTTSGGHGSGVVITGTYINNQLRLTVSDRGEGFYPSDFAQSTSLNNPSASKVKLTPLNIKGNGTGLEAYVMYGVVYDKIVTIEAPKEVATTTSLGPTTQNWDKPGGVLTGVDKNIIKFNNLSTNNKYRMFFHFHNTCSSAFYNHDDYRQTGAPTPSYDQYITINVK